MRQIFLDTETTGKTPTEGHRIVEIGALVVNRRQITNEVFHTYLNPKRDNSLEAYKVHGLSNEYLATQPEFKDKVSDFLKFIQGAELIIHNAAFDIGFLNYELELLNDRYAKETISTRFRDISHYCGKITDSLFVARRLHPNQRNSLDALCKRYQVENLRQTMDDGRHTARVDAELLARVYLHMTSGQTTLFSKNSYSGTTTRITDQKTPLKRLKLKVHRALPEELTAHQHFLRHIDPSLETW